MATLNLHNPEGLYSGGTVSINALPYARFAQDIKEKRQAREDAINKHFQDLPNTINDKGVRDQEIEGLNTMKNDIYAFGQKNKAALMNPKLDNGAAQFTLQKMFRDASGYAQESKNRTATSTKLAQLRGNPKYDYIFRDPQIIDKIASHEATVGTEGSQSINFNQLTLPPEPWSTQESKYLQSFKDIKPDVKIETSQNPNDKYTLLETSTPTLNKVDKDKVYVGAANLIDNPSFEADIKKKMEADPNLIGQLQQTFKDNYGRDFNPVTLDHDIAAAYTIMRMGNAGVKQRTIPNKDALMDRQEAFKEDQWMKHNKITYQQSLNKIRLNNQNRKEGLPTEEMGYVSDEVSDAVGKDVDVTLGGKTSRKRLVYVDDVDPERLDIITGRDLSKKKLGVKPIPFKGGKFGYYVDPNTGDWEGEDGQKISREAVKDRYIQSKAGTKFKAQTGTKGSENTTKQKTKGKYD